jgi:hypothetical protein
MRRLLSLITVLGAVALATTAATAGASRSGLITGLVNGNCGAASPVFSSWHDYASYYFAPNGGFEGGTTGWSLSGPESLANANDPFRLSGPGSHALQLAAGGTAAINVCYGLTFPAVRFVVAGVNGPATIRVRVVAHSLLGLLSVLDGGTFTVQSGWDAAPKISTLFSAVAAPLGTKSMELRITVESGTAQIDDLFVDPWLTKV